MAKLMPSLSSTSAVGSGNDCVYFTSTSPIPSIDKGANFGLGVVATSTADELEEFEVLLELLELLVCSRWRCAHRPALIILSEPSKKFPWKIDKCTLPRQASTIAQAQAVSTLNFARKHDDDQDMLSRFDRIACLLGPVREGHSEPRENKASATSRLLAW